MSGLFTLASQLQELNQTLQDKHSDRASRHAVRAGLETHVGEFKLARKMSDAQIRDLFQGQALVGVDGSVNQFGGNYPYTIQLFKALAKSTLPSRDGSGRTIVEKVELFSPLRKDDYKKIHEFIKENKHNLSVSPVSPQEDQEITRELAEGQAYAMMMDQNMVALELDVAIDALKQFQPRLMLMDGGFSRLKGKGGDKWDEFVDTALVYGTIIVGVIEEVGSYRLQSRLDEQLLEGFVRGHDREILFGTLEQGEWLKTSIAKPIKNEFYTVFTRLSDLPQAGACDFLREQYDQVDDVIDFLYTITPDKSRGIPLWLDIVDAEVRLTKKQIDLMIKTNLDQANIETFFRPQRDRRDF